MGFPSWSLGTRNMTILVAHLGVRKAGVHSTSFLP